MCWRCQWKVLPITFHLSMHRFNILEDAKSKTMESKGFFLFGFAGFSAECTVYWVNKLKKGSKLTNILGRSSLLSFLRKINFVPILKPYDQSLWNHELAAVIEACVYSCGKTKSSVFELKSPLLDNLWNKIWGETKKQP